MSDKEYQKILRFREAYDNGVKAHKAGLPDVNQYSKADLMQYCAWSGGYFDSKRGMV